jgi:integrase/recombinase XerD
MCSLSITESQLLTRRVAKVGTIDPTEMEQRLFDRYAARGWSKQVLINDRATLRRVCARTGDPDLVTLEDMESVVMKATSQGSRANYVARIKSIFATLRELELTTNTADLKLAKVRKPRGLPRPISEAQAQILLTQAKEPYRSWFVLGCYAGLRAMEISGLTGADLEQGPEGYVLRIRGKGGTDLTIPAHPEVVRVIKEANTLGRLYFLNPNKISSYACKEMKRLGVPMKYHSLRHYFATSALKASGGDLLVVRDLLRHQSVATTQVYAQLGEGRTRSVIELLNVQDS